MKSCSPSPSPRIKKEWPISSNGNGKDPSPKVLPELAWLDDACVQDMDHLAKTVAGIKAKGLRPDLLGSILSHCVSRWLPELSGSAATTSSDPSPDSPTAAWLKKRFFVETLVAVLPVDKGALPCDLLLRLLRAACMVGAEAACVQELEGRAAAQLDEASLKELMIPAFSHTSGTLLDVGLVLRLVRRFVGAEGVAAVAAVAAGARSGAALSRVAKLVDSYLVEAALDAGLAASVFEEIARAVPVHARALDDGLYLAIDTYIKVHPNVSKQEKRTLGRLIDARKLTAEASFHAVQNERLPVRLVIQVLFSEHTKLHRVTDWSGSFSGPRSPNPALEKPGRCLSKREVLAHQQEMRRLRDDVARLQAHCHALQSQLVKITSDKKKRGFFRWSNFAFRSSDSVGRIEEYDFATEQPTPPNHKGRMARQKATPTKWRHSMS